MNIQVNLNNLKSATLIDPDEIDISDEDMYRHILDDNSTNVDDDGYEYKTVHSKSIKILQSIDELMIEISKCKGLAYDIEVTETGLKKLIHLPLSKYFYLLYEHIWHMHSVYDYSEFVKLFLEIVETLQLRGFANKRPWSICGQKGIHYQNPRDAKRAGEYFNDFIALARDRLKSEGFTDRIRQRESNSKRNFKSAFNYVKELFDDHHSRLQFIRLDFSYKSQFKRDVTVKMIRKDLKRLLNNRRTNKMFRGLAGYIWALEYGELKHLHYHVIFIFKGSELRCDVTRATKLAKYWEERITKGRGLAFNCNRKKSEYKHLAIGPINHYDTALRNNISYVLKYLTKTSQYLRVNVENLHCFGHGETPERLGNSGRPRKVSEAT